MLSSVFSIYKHLGKTPLQALEELRSQYPELENEPLAYAGRLDPMAEGVLLVLRGEACKKRDIYQQLPKTYEIDVIFGVATDTYDTLGLITSFTPEKARTISQEVITQLLTQLQGKRQQNYPPYSAARVNGKPLYYWARNGISVPPLKREVEIYSLTLTAFKQILSNELLASIRNRVSLVSGDFRQEKILETWEHFLSTNYIFPVLTLSTACSSGTYMRSLAHELGGILGSGAIAYTIKRTQVGEFRISDCLTLS
jgi:tRNA pseudouridine55 synthase